MAGVSWELVLILASSGIVMALLSCLIGMRPGLEMPLWWVLYATWIAIAVNQTIAAPFRTLLISSILAGLLHGATTALLLDRYVANNPWHAEKTQGPKRKLAVRFVMMGIVVGTVFGVVVAGIGWAIAR